jgi:trk system potassium uptake protein TrkH
MIDRHSLFFVHGVLLAVTGLAMILPALAGALAGTGDAAAFLVAAAVTLAVGGLLIAAGQGRALRLNRKTGFFLAVSAWINVSLFAALPFYFVGQPHPLRYVDCWFEAVSGITTTGSSIFEGLDALPKGLLLWRGLLNWLGGIGTIAVAFVLMPYLQIGGMQLYRMAAASGTPSPQGAKRIAIAVGAAYGVLSVICAVLYWLEGMSLLDALVYAMATVSTGGFTTHDASLGFFSDPAIQWTALVFMIASAAPFLLYARMGQGEFLALARDPQLRSFVIVLIVVTVFLTLTLIGTGKLGPQGAFRAVAVSAASFATTTGFVTADWGSWGPLAGSTIFLLAVIGGCSGSPAGGLKMMRVQILLRLTLRQIRRLMSPRAVIPLRYNGQVVSSSIMVSVAVFAFVYVGMIGVLGFALALTGLDPLTSLTGAAAALGNVTHGLGPVIGPTSSYARLPDDAKLLLAGGMLMGRLELFTVLVLFSPRYWRS